MAKPPKIDSDKIPQIDDAEVKAAQERLKARIEDSKKRDEARKPSEGQKPAKAARPKKAVKPKAPKKPKPPKSGVSIGTVALCSLLAAGIGGAIGWLGPHYYNSSGEDAALAQLQSRLTAAEAQIKTQNQSLSAAQSDVSRVSEIDGLAAQMKTVSGAVDDNSAAIKAAAAQRVEFAERMEVTQAMLGEDASAKPNIILERIEAMEAKVTEIAARPAAQPAPKGLVITAPSVISYETAGTAKTTQIKDAAAAEKASTPETETEEKPQPKTQTPSAIEVVPSTVQAALGSPASTAAATKVITYDFVGNFPRAAMLAVVEVEAAPEKSKNWFKRKLDEHMQSGASEAQNARRDILRAEELTRRGDITAAATLIKRQSPAVQTSARAWLTAAAAQE